MMLLAMQEAIWENKLAKSLKGKRNAGQEILKNGWNGDSGVRF